MTPISEKIRTVIIDDDEIILESLKKHLNNIPEIEITACATRYKQAKQVLLHESFDLLFLDIEMPGKNGFELLDECRKAGKNGFSVIFHTAYDNYVIRALRESALDYILKPVKPAELKDAVERFKLNKKSQRQTPLPVKSPAADIVALPTITGIRFTDKNAVLLFQWQSDSLFGKKSWIVVLTDGSELKLKSGTSAKNILDNMGASMFIRINPSVIVNLQYLATIEYASRECILFPPFNNIKLIASRSNIIEIREKFDLL